MPQTNTFRELQSGDAIRVILKDSSTLDCTFRRFLLGGANTIVVTTPVGEDDPNLQQTYYIDDYTQLVRPIPITQAADIPDGFFEPGDAVEVRFDNVGSSQLLSGTLAGYDKTSGLLAMTVLGSPYIVRDFWYARKL